MGDGGKEMREIHREFANLQPKVMLPVCRLSLLNSQIPRTEIQTKRSLVQRQLKPSHQEEVLSPAKAYLECPLEHFQVLKLNGVRVVDVRSRQAQFL